MDRDLTTVLAGLYDSEINFDIHAFYDGGVECCLGDEKNGFKEVHTYYGGQLHLMAEWFHINAIKHWPTSKYALDFAAGKPHLVHTRD